jgi:hypothetical protein
MEKKFICPKCKGYLNVGTRIILGAKSESNDSGIVLFNSEIGNYSTEINSEFDVKPGEKVDFFCPICSKKLASDIHDDLSKIIMIDKGDKKYEILFSKIAGEKSTYKIIGESIEVFGDDHSNYINFINLSSSK